MSSVQNTIEAGEGDANNDANATHTSTDDTPAASLPSYPVGSFVSAMWKGVGLSYDAYIEAVRKSAGEYTYSIIYSDGDMDLKAPSSYIVSSECKSRGQMYTCKGQTEDEKGNKTDCDAVYIEWRIICPKCKTRNPRIVRARVDANQGAQTNVTRVSSRKKFMMTQSEIAERDAENFRKGYPGQVDNPNANHNILFFMNKKKMVPDSCTIEEFLSKWKGAYYELESGHSFIQWIFPIREKGMNYAAQPLQKWEATRIASTPELQRRLIRVYRLMLDFYGMRLADEETGEIARNDNWKSRYENLCNHPHNYLRITRILKCLHECGLTKFQYPFVKFVLQEIYENRQLLDCAQSAKSYWLAVVVDDAERQKLKDYIAERRALALQNMGKGGGNVGVPRENSQASESSTSSDD